MIAAAHFPCRCSPIRRWVAVFYAILTLVFGIHSRAGDFTFSTFEGHAKVDSYTGPGGNITIPTTGNGLPVNEIGYQAFWNNQTVRNVTILGNVTNIEQGAFYFCQGLTNVTIAPGLIRVGEYAFYNCSALGSITLPDTVKVIEQQAFDSCSSLTNIVAQGVEQIGYACFSSCPFKTFNAGISAKTLADNVFLLCRNLESATFPKTLETIGANILIGCQNLKAVYFKGNPPIIQGGSVGAGPFEATATIYYLPGATGWGTTFGARPALLWNPEPVTAGSQFGIKNGAFGFSIGADNNVTVVIEACTDLFNPKWSAVSANDLVTSPHFTDALPANSPARFFRLRSP